MHVCVTVCCEIQSVYCSLRYVISPRPTRRLHLHVLGNRRNAGNPRAVRETIHSVLSQKKQALGTQDFLLAVFDSHSLLCLRRVASSEVATDLHITTIPYAYVYGLTVCKYSDYVVRFTSPFL